MTDAAQIARGLTKAQRDCLIKRAGDKTDFNAIVRAGLATYEPIHHSIPGMSGRCRIGYKADLTPLGLAVRAELERNSHDEQQLSRTN